MNAGTALLAAIVFGAACSAHAADLVKEEGMWPRTWPAELEPLRKQSRTVRGSLLDLTTYEIPFTTREQFESAWPHLLKIKGEGAPVVLLRGPDKDLGIPLKAGVRIRCALGFPEQEVAPAAPISGATRLRERWLRSTYLELVVDGGIVDLNRIPLPAETPIVDQRFGAPGPPRPKVGEPAPAIEATHSDGNGLAAADLAGKVVLVVFWRLDEGGGLPFGRLVPLRRAYADRPNFLILTVCTNGADRWDEWAAFIAAQGDVDYGDGRRRFLDDPRWWNVSEYTERISPSKTYGITDLPEYDVIGADGRLVALNVAPDELRTVLDRALGIGK